MSETAKEQLLNELAQLRRRVAELSESEAALKRRVAALHQGGDYYRALVEINPNIVYRLNEDGKIIVISPTVQQLGYDPAELIGRRFEDIVHPDDRSKSRDQFVERRIGDRRMKNQEIRLMTKNQEPHDYELRYKTVALSARGQWNVADSDIADPRKVFICTQGVACDISERKQAENALRASEEFNTRLLAAIPDFVVLTDIEGNIQFVNDACFKISGYAPEEVLGKNMLAFVDEGDRQRAMQIIPHIHAGRMELAEYNLIMKDHRKLAYEIGGDALRNADGQAFGIVLVCRNITERKQAEADRGRLEAQLLQARKMEAIGTLAGGIAHDFNNILMGIQGYTSLMLIGMPVGNPHYERLRAVENQVRSGADLTRQLLGFARGGRYEVKPTDLNDLISQTASLFGRAKKEIRIHEKYESNIWPVDVDRGQIEQVLLNLFVNAWQAMPGGGELFLETRNVHLDASYVAPYEIKTGPYVKMSITDSGGGMDEKTRQRIFDPFFTTKEMGRGTGLGLASAYGIIKGHGGLINVYSEKGHGSTFSIYLPITEKQAAREELSTPAIIRGHETILIVDDEKTIIDVTGEMIQALGYRVLTANSGPEAIELYKARVKDIDLIILDMIMPDMGGKETYDKLKEINPSVKVILASGYSINGMAKSIMEKGVQLFMQKPFRLDDLSQQIRSVLEG